jgi:hypothetical protein
LVEGDEDSRVKAKRWQTVKELFEAALERGAEERSAF